MANIHNLIDYANVMNIRMRLLARKTEILVERLRILQRVSIIEISDSLTVNIGADNCCWDNCKYFILNKFLIN